MKVRFVSSYSWVMTAEGWRPIFHSVERIYADALGPVALAPLSTQGSESGLNDFDGEPE